MRGERAKKWAFEVKKNCFTFEAGMSLKTKAGKMVIWIAPDEL